MWHFCKLSQCCSTPHVTTLQPQRCFRPWCGHRLKLVRQNTHTHGGRPCSVEGSAVERCQSAFLHRLNSRAQAQAQRNWRSYRLASGIPIQIGVILVAAGTIDIDTSNAAVRAWTYLSQLAHIPLHLAWCVRKSAKYRGCPVMGVRKPITHKMEDVCRVTDANANDDVRLSASCSGPVCSVSAHHTMLVRS